MFVLLAPSWIVRLISRDKATSHGRKGEAVREQDQRGQQTSWVQTRASGGEEDMGAQWQLRRR